MKKQWVVRIVHQWTNENERHRRDMKVLITEMLRYAGFVRMHVDEDDRLVFDLLPASNSAREDSGMWAQMNAERISSFGWNAVKAPAWENFKG